MSVLYKVCCEKTNSELMTLNVSNVVQVIQEYNDTFETNYKLLKEKPNLIDETIITINRPCDSAKWYAKVGA